MPKTFAFVIDFTYDGQKVFALEMGDFFKSGLSGLDRLRQKQNLIPLHDEYFNQLHQKYPTAIYLKDETTPWTSAIQFYDFSNGLKARCNFRGDRLIPDLLYSRALLGTENFFKRPIVASFQANGFPPELRSPLDKLQKDQQNALDILNYPSGVLIDACQDKVVFHRFTDETGFCPETIVIDLSNINFNDIVQFLDENSSSHYVIKPTNMSLGRGVEVIESKKVIELIQQLQKIVDQSEVSKSRFQSDSNLSIWKQIIVERGNHFLLLQTCCPSKEINYEGKAYCPTARAVIEATFSDDSTVLPTLQFLGSYWKFPAQKSETISTLSMVSHVDDDSPTAMIESHDWQNIESQLQTHLPLILLNLYSTEFDKLSTHFESSPALKRYQKILEIDQISRKRLRGYILPRSSNAISSFEGFTYGGPGFSEHLNYFKNALCTPSGLVETSEQNPSIVSDSVSQNITFFKPNLDSLSLSVEEKSELTANDSLGGETIQAENNAVMEDAAEEAQFIFKRCQIF